MKIEVLSNIYFCLYFEHENYQDYTIPQINLSNFLYISQVFEWNKQNHLWRSWVWTPSKGPIVSLSKKLYPYCLVLVGSGTDLIVTKNESRALWKIDLNVKYAPSLNIVKPNQNQTVWPQNNSWLVVTCIHETFVR